MNLNLLGKENNASSIKHKILRVWFIWGIAAVFYGYEFLLRASPRVMQTDLMRAFGFDASSLGFMVSLYYWAYAPMQIPAGILLDKYGPKVILTAAAFLCSVSIIYLGLTESAIFASMSRFMIGFGSSFALIGSFKLIGNWFPSSRFAFIAGLTLTFGTLGASLAGKPLVYIMECIGWRESLFFLGIIGFLNTSLLWLIVQDSPLKISGNIRETPINKTGSKDELKVWDSFKLVIRRPQNWLIGACTAFMYIPVVCFGEFWGVPYVMKLCSCTKTDAAGSTALIFIGITLGAPFFGYISDYWKNRKIPLYVGITVTFLIMSFVVYAQKSSIEILSILMFILGFFLSSVIILFALIKESNPANLSGAAVGFGNFICMIIPGTFQFLIGVVLSTLNPELSSISETSYSILSFRVAFLLFPISLILAYLCLRNVQETYGQAFCGPHFS